MYRNITRRCEGVEETRGEERRGGGGERGKITAKDAREKTRRHGLQKKKEKRKKKAGRESVFSPSARAVRSERSKQKEHFYPLSCHVRTEEEKKGGKKEERS